MTKAKGEHIWDFALGCRFCRLSVMELIKICYADEVELIAIAAAIKISFSQRLIRRENKLRTWRVQFKKNGSSTNMAMKAKFQE